MAVVSSAILPAPTSRTASGIGHERQRMAASARATDQRNTELRTHRNGGSGRPPRSMRSTGDQRILDPSLSFTSGQGLRGPGVGRIGETGRTALVSSRAHDGTRHGRTRFGQRQSARRRSSSACSRWRRSAYTLGAMTAVTARLGSASSCRGGSAHQTRPAHAVEAATSPHPGGRVA